MALSYCSGVSGARQLLARRLGRMAIAGLGSLVLVAMILLALNLAGLWFGWLALTAGAVYRAAGWVAAAALAGAVCALLSYLLFVPLPRIDGVLLPRRGAGSFYQLIAKMKRRFGVSSIAGVWISGSMNAAVTQRMRWGFFGPLETHLVVGLPLAHSLSRKQLVAVLAHEFSHIALQRRGADAWLAYCRAWWLRVLERTCGVFPFAADFLDAVFAWFYRDMVRLTHLEEFEADAMAAELVGADVFGQTLVEVTLKERFLAEDYWPRIMAQSALHPRPLMRPYREMGIGVAAGFIRPSAGKIMQHPWARSGGAGGLHPPLGERLHALRVPLQMAEKNHLSAASHYWAPLLPALARTFDRAWWREVRRSWRRLHRDDICGRSGPREFSARAGGKKAREIPPAQGR